MSAKPGQVAAVVPTLDRLEDLRRCLAAVRGGTRVPDMLVVVDNGSSDGTRAELSAAPDVTTVLAPGNLGAVGGFQAGMDAAFEAGASWAWLLDDDAVPAPDALELLLARASAEGSGERVGGAVPTVQFGDGRRETGWLWGRRAERGHGQSPNSPDRPGGPALDVDWAPFAGLLLSRAGCRQVGALRTDFVLWHADVEYCLRLRAAGFTLRAVPQAVVGHPAMPLVSRRLLGRTVAVGRIDPWREYYDTRNRVILTRLLRHGPLDAAAPLPRVVTREVARDLAVLVADPRGRRRVLWRAIGLVDGLRGRLARRPELGTERMSSSEIPTAAVEQAWPEADLEAVGACPACRSPRRSLLHGGLRDRIVASPGTWSLWRCWSCGSAYLDPRPTASSIERAYGGDYVTHEPPVDRSAGNAARARHRLLNGYLNRRYGYGLEPAVAAGAWIVPRLPYLTARTDRWIRHLHPSPGRTRLLDFGCGNGEFLLQMRDLGWSVQGLDFDPEAVAEATSAGLAVRLGSLDALDPEIDRFDAITLGHVIEHLHDPLATLRQARGLLEPGGMIWMATPNVQALGHRLFGESWFALDPPRHLVLFNVDSLPGIVREAGFERVEVLPPVPTARWLFPPSLAITRGRHPLKEQEPLPPPLRLRATVAELAARRRPELAEELIVAGWVPQA